MADGLSQFALEATADFVDDGASGFAVASSEFDFYQLVVAEGAIYFRDHRIAESLGRNGDHRLEFVA